jgi:hypothetical protein
LNYLAQLKKSLDVQRGQKNDGCKQRSRFLFSETGKVEGFFAAMTPASDKNGQERRNCHVSGKEIQAQLEKELGKKKVKKWNTGKHKGEISQRFVVPIERKAKLGSS